MTTKTAKPKTPRSDAFTWTDEYETFWFLGSEWDVQAAKAIIREGKPRKVERVQVTDLEPWLGKYTDHGDGTGSIRPGVNVDRERVASDDTIDLAIPLIAVVTPNGHGLPIDGWHRVARAVAQGVTDLPIVFLNKRESAKVRM